MSVAPEPYRTACLEVLHLAVVKARMIAFEDDFEREQLRDLMDAVHNIPRWLNDWQNCEQDELRWSLAHYDERWAFKGCPKLSTIYDEAIERSRSD
jgi:hypothetical protein